MERLTFYGGGFLGAPKAGEAPIAAQAHRLDSTLAQFVVSSETTANGEAEVAGDKFLYSRLQFHLTARRGGKAEMKDIEVFDAIVHSVGDWTSELFTKAQLGEEQKEVLDASFFDNELGRAGLSIVVEINSLMVAEKMGVTPVPFAQGKLLPQTTSDVPLFQQGQTYTRYYTGSNNIPQQTENREDADGFVRCSYAQLSMSLIQKMGESLQSTSLTSLVEDIGIVPASVLERAQYVGELSDGINQEGGLIYTLARNISS